MCYRLNDGMLKAISNAVVSMVSESPAEASRMSAGSLEKVGNRVVAIASINTCKH